MRAIFDFIGRTAAIILIVLALHFLVGCSFAPIRTVVAPSVAPVRDRIASAKSKLIEAKASMQSNNVAAAAAQISGAEVELEAASTNLTQLQATTVELAANAVQDQLDRQKAEARDKAHVAQRNRCAIAAVALALFVFRKPLLQVAGAAARAGRMAVGIPV